MDNWKKKLEALRPNLPSEKSLSSEKYNFNDIKEKPKKSRSHPELSDDEVELKHKKEDRETCIRRWRMNLSTLDGLKNEQLVVILFDKRSSYSEDFDKNTVNVGEARRYAQRELENYVNDEHLEIDYNFAIQDLSWRYLPDHNPKQYQRMKFPRPRKRE